MLAQNFKTAADLGISNTNLEALIKVLGMLERGELQHTPDPETFEGSDGFNMADYNFSDTNACGTVHCIAGWCDRLFKTDFVGLHMISPPEGLPHSLNDLFSGAPGKNWNTTAGQAAVALRSYLTTGDPNWAEAFA